MIVNKYDAIHAIKIKDQTAAVIILHYIFSIHH